MKLNTLIIFFILITLSAKAQEEILHVENETKKLEGTLLSFDTNSKEVVFLIIAGSGPTDRNGNNTSMQNNSLKMLAEGLLGNGFPSLRYDKRGIGKSELKGVKEEDVLFDDFVQDAVDWVKLLQDDEGFKNVIIIGHSQGSLVGMLAAKQTNASGFISIAGAGKSIDQVLSDQLSQQMPGWMPMIDAKLDSIKNGETVVSPPLLESLFRPSVQPFLHSWMQYSPPEELLKLKVPSLIIQGDQDLQVSSQDALLLLPDNSSGASLSKLVMIENMNHVLKDVGTDASKNRASYNDPELPLHKVLLPSIDEWFKESY